MTMTKQNIHQPTTNTMHPKKALNQWIQTCYNPNYFLTIQFPDWMRNKNPAHAQEKLRKLMSLFERALIGRFWSKKHLPFIVFSEHGASNDWHYHILFNSQLFNPYQLQNAIYVATLHMSIPLFAMDLRPIENTPNNVFYYSEKELHIYENKNFDSDRIILSHDLFHIPFKESVKRPFNTLTTLYILYCLKSNQDPDIKPC